MSAFHTQSQMLSDGHATAAFPSIFDILPALKDGEDFNQFQAISNVELASGLRCGNPVSLMLAEMGSASVRRAHIAAILIGCAANLALQGGVKSADGVAVQSSASSAAFAVARCTGG